MDLIIIAGMPTLEKTTVTAAVSKAFGYPMLEKDYLKEGLFDILGSESYAQKRDLDCAVDEILIRVSEALLRAGSSVIIDNNFDTAGGEKFRRLIEKYTPKCVTVFLNGEAPREGGSPGDTAAGEASDEKSSRRGTSIFCAPGARLDVDTAHIDSAHIDGIIARIRKLLVTA